MKKTIQIITAFTSLLAAVSLNAAPTVFTGVYSNNFNALATGTAMPIGFRTMVTGSGNSIYTAANPITSAGIAAATVSGTQTLTVWTPPAAVASSGAALFNCGVHTNTTDRALGSDATSAAAMVMELSLTNTIGSNLLGVVFNYDQRCLTNGSAGTEASELPGYAFFYSTSGGTTAAEWTRVEALSLTNFTQGTALNSGNVTITFAPPLTNNGLMYFRWADDNNVASSPDQMIAIDNVLISISTNVPPVVTLTAPANGGVVMGGTNLPLSATATDANGTVTKVEFFSGATLLATLTNAPYNFVYSNLALGSYSFTARATDNNGAAATSAAALVNCVPDLGTGGLYFDGANDYVTFGAATTSLGVSNFTVECWFRRTGAGVTTSTGTGGVTATPLVTKGKSESDGSNVDCNYFLGFDANGKLAADFEDYNNGLNHPITGNATIASNEWQHAAVTYQRIGTNGSWALYLNGALDATNSFSGTNANVATPRFDSLQHAGLGTAMNSSGTAAGFLNGKLDEVRLWNYARSAAEIAGNYLGQLTNAPGLIARWSLDETNGLTVSNSIASGVNGTLSNGPVFVSGFPFNNPPQFNRAPDAPLLVAPAANATGVANPPTLQVAVADPDTNNLKVTFYGRPASIATNQDFTIIALPDTQFYSQTYSNVFIAQTEWIITNRSLLNIGYVAQLGDCVQNGDNGGNDIEWRNATNALYRLENPVTTSLANGIPYGVAVGNHDQGATGNGDPLGSTTFYNLYFGTNHFLPYNYYGGNYGSNNDNHYDLFSVGGYDFIAIYFEYDSTMTTNSAVLAWADNLLKTYPNRRGIAVSHWIINSYTAGSTFGAQGQAIYDALKVNTNLSLMLCGHVNPNGEGRRTDIYNGSTVQTLLSDYQDLANGGNGWLRIYTFSPGSNVIRAKTYSPFLNQFQTGTNSQFEVPYPLTPASPFTLIGTISNAPSGSTVSQLWAGLATNTTYEWYAVVDDGKLTNTSPVVKFTTDNVPAPLAPSLALTNPANGASYLTPANIVLGAVANDADGFVTNVAFYQGATKLAEFTAAPYQFAWTNVGVGGYALTAVATDNSGLSTTSAVVSITVTQEAAYVIHISVDGLRPDAITALGSANLPNFYRLRTQGAFTDNARTDYDYTITLPNHTSQLTGRGVTGASGHNWTSNTDPSPGQTLASNKGSYLAGAFDVAHDNGFRTAEFASKSKFSLYETSWNITNGAPDVTGLDNGRDKIDVYVNLSDTSALLDALVSQMSTQACHYVFLHLADPDNVGHASGWNITPGSAYSDAIKTIDNRLGRIFNLIETNAALTGRTTIILSADHGGTGTDHSDATLAVDYTIPFYAWGRGVATNADLYALNLTTRTNPGTSRPNYAASAQPIRNGDMANAALTFLGLGPVPGSTINNQQNLAFTAPLAAPGIVSILPGNTNVNAGGTATFTVTATGSAPLNYQWHRGISLVGVNSSNLVLNPVACGAAGQYFVVVSNAIGAVTSAPVTLTVQDVSAPVILWSFTNLSLNAASNCSVIMPDVTGTNAVLANDACSSTLIITQTPTNGVSLAAGTTNQVILAVADSSGNTAYSTNQIVVLDVSLPVILSAPASQTNNAGTPVSFAVVATACTPLNYQWYFGLNSVTNQTNSVLNLPSVGPANAGNYQVVVTSAGGVTNTSVASLVVVYQAPNITGTPTIQGAGDFQFSFSGPAGQTYQVLASDDLAAPPAVWTVVGSGTFGNTNALFTDSGATHHPGRFYIVKSP